MTDRALRGAEGLVFSRRHFVIGTVLAGVSAGAFASLPQVRYPKIDEKKFESWIPQAVGGWRVTSVSGVVLPPPDALSDRLYDNLVTRVYTKAASPPVMMLIAYNNIQDGVLQLHRPEICYPAGGFRLTPTEPVALTLGSGREIPANAFTAEGARRTEQVLYWTRLGDSFPQKWIDQRISVMRANLKGDIPDGTLMRVSVIEPDRHRAVATLSDFLKTFLDVTTPELRRLLIGHA